MPGVTLNLPNINLALNTPTGVVTPRLLLIGEQIAECATGNAQKIIRNLPPEFLKVTVEQDAIGVKVVVKPDGAGRISGYLAAKEQREESAWLQPCVDSVRI